MTACPHCGRVVHAERDGHGIALGASYASHAAFLLGARCPYPECARPVFARARGPHRSDASAASDTRAHPDLVLSALPDGVAWSPSLFASVAREWLLPCAVVLGFAAVPAYGLHEAFASARCGGIAWLFFAAGSLLALVPILYFVRGLGCVARDAQRAARLSRAAATAGRCRGLRVSPEPTTYRSH
jgi:hypothetical protein